MELDVDDMFDAIDVQHAIEAKEGNVITLEHKTSTNQSCGPNATQTQTQKFG